MLLNAAQSLLLLPAAPPQDEPGHSLALLRAAAERLQVPQVSMNSANWRLGLATGRDQLIAAGLLGGPEIAALPPGTQVFLVIDCMAEADRPPEAGWSALDATPVTTEMVIFEWLERGGTEAFRDLIPLIKERS